MTKKLSTPNGNITRRTALKATGGAITATAAATLPAIASAATSDLSENDQLICELAVEYWVARDTAEEIEPRLRAAEKELPGWAYYPVQFDRLVESMRERTNVDVQMFKMTVEEAIEADERAERIVERYKRMYYNKAKNYRRSVGVEQMKEARDAAITRMDAAFEAMHEIEPDTANAFVEKARVMARWRTDVLSHVRASDVSPLKTMRDDADRIAGAG